MARFEVRLADTADLRQLVYRFRYDVYVKKMGRRQIYADHSAECVVEPMDASARNYIALLDGKPIGSIRANSFDDPRAKYYRSIYRIHQFPELALQKVQLTTKLMLLPQYQGTSYGPRLIQAYAAEGYRLGVEVDFIDCNKHLIPFFERMGYFSYTGWVFHKEYGTVRPMFLAVDTISYLRRLGSILSSAASQHIIDGQYGGYELVRRHGETPTTNLARGIAALEFAAAASAAA